MANWRSRSQTYSMEAYLSTFSISTWHLLAVFRWLALGHHFNLLHCSLWAHVNVQEQADLKEICDSVSQTLILKLAIYPIPIIASHPKECLFVKDFSAFSFHPQGIFTLNVERKSTFDVISSISDESRWT